jgi:hypothetical protein
MGSVTEHIAINKVYSGAPINIVTTYNNASELQLHILCSTQWARQRFDFLLFVYSSSKMDLKNIAGRQGQNIKKF